MESIVERDEYSQQPAAPGGPEPETLAQLKAGANWFYWIAGLSLVNSLIFAFGGNVSFILGLAYTQIIDAIADVSITEGASAAMRAVAIILDLILVAIFALFGYYANKAINTVFIVGIVIYVVDGVLWLMLSSYFAAGFHVYALFMIVRGFMASREVNKFNLQNMVIGA